MARNKWTEEEKEFIKANYKTMTDAELHQHIPNHTIASIQTWRRRNGCHYDNPYNKKYSYDDVVRYMNDYGYELLSVESEYQNAGTPMRYKCNIHHDVEQTTTLGHLLEGKKCRYCGIETTASKRRIDILEGAEKDKRRCTELGFEYINTVRGENVSGERKVFIEFICGKHKNIGVQRMPRYNMYRNIHGCVYCAHKKFADGEIIELCKQNSPRITILSNPVIMVNQRVECECSKHGVMYNIRVGEIMAGKACAKCGLEKLAAACLLTEEEVQERLKINHPNAVLESEYRGEVVKLTLRCTKCGHLYPAYLNSPKQCPNCERYYYGERMIQEYLESRNIVYIYLNTNSKIV